MRFARSGFALTALVALTLATACSSDNSSTPSGTNQDLSGTYTLTKLEQGTGSTFIEVPGVTGTFVLTATTYTATINNVPVIGTIIDEGTYTAVGTATSGTFTQNSTTQGTQGTGTYTYDAATRVLVLQTVVNGQNQRVTVQKS